MKMTSFSLLNDYFYFSAGKLSIEVPLNLTMYLNNERDYLPWTSALDWIYKMSNLLSLTPVYGIYEVCGMCLCVCACVYVSVHVRVPILSV